MALLSLFPSILVYFEGCCLCNYERIDELARRLFTLNGFSFYQLKFSANLGASQTTGI